MYIIFGNKAYTYSGFIFSHLKASHTLQEEARRTGKHEMFWRRKKSDASGSSKVQRQQQQEKEEDEMTKLQRQFGIKPVSDADVQAEFHKLFGGNGGGAAGATGLSPRSELLLLGGVAVDDDDEASILRALNLNGMSEDKLDIDGLDLSDDDEGDDAGDGDGHDAKRELSGVLREVHTTAVHYQSQNDPIQMYTGGQQRRTETHGVVIENHEQVTARVQELKRQAITLKREGKVKDALALFRQAKDLAAQLEASGSVSVQSAVSVQQQQQRQAPVAPLAAVERVHEAYHDDDDGDGSDVEVTEDDMQDPEFLAQLAKMGLPVDIHAHTIASLEAQIQDAKLKAVECKRSNQIQDALQWMRKIKELEVKLAQHQSLAVDMAHARSSSTTTTAVANAVVQQSVTTETTTSRRGSSDRVETSHVYTSAPMSVERYTEEDKENLSDVEVTENDMEDPAFAEELRKLGFNGSEAETTTAGGGYHSSTAPVVSSRSASESTMVTTISSERTPVFQTSLSIGDEDLIDAFDEDEDEDKEDFYSTTPAYSSSSSSSATRVGYGTLSATEAPVVHTVDPPPQQDHQQIQAELMDLKSQLQHAKESAIRLKREGNIKEALETMRRMKQIETLIEHKQKRHDSQASVVESPAVVVQDPVIAAKFHELEQLLVDFGNRALALAKENLSVDRAAATEWLNKVSLRLPGAVGQQSETRELQLTVFCSDIVVAEGLRG